jgi:UDP-glucose 4-epimerase
MRILITGGAGFIGSHLVGRFLSKSDDELIVLDNFYRSCRGSLGGFEGHFQLHEGDVRDVEALSSAMRGVDLVYHLAAQSNVLGAASDMDYAFTTNTVGTYNVLREAKRQSVARVVFASSREVYGEVAALPVTEDAPLRPKNGYGASKAAGEMYCRAFNGAGLEVVILRLANVYGPGDSNRVIPLFVQSAASGQPLTVYGQNKILDFVWVGDVEEALVQAGLRDVSGQTFNIGSGKGTTLHHLAERILAVCGSQAPIIEAPARGGEVDQFVADIRLATTMLNYAPASDPLRYLNSVLGSPEHADRALAVAV